MKSSKKLAFIFILLAVSAVSTPVFAKDKFKVCWSIYVGWMPWDYGAKEGIVRKWADKYGITIDVVREPSDGYWANVWMKKPWCACYWSGRPTADSMLSIAYAADAAWNDTFWKHDSFNALLKAGRAELDESKRREIYVEMQQILSDEGGVVVPMFANYVFAASNKLKHDKIAANWDVDGQKFSERWWFD